MYSDRAVFVILFRVIFFAAVGGLVIAFAGVIFSVLGLLLLFAIVGFLVWMPLYSCFFGPNKRLKTYLENAKSISNRVFRRCLPHFVTGKNWIGHTGECVWFQTRRFGVILLETISGAMLGCLVVLLRSDEMSVLPMMLGLGGGALLGAAIALSVTAMHHGRARRCAHDTPSSSSP